MARRYTLLRSGSAMHQAFTALAGAGTEKGPELVVYSKAWSELPAEDHSLYQPVNIDPVIPEGESPVVPPVVFDINSSQPQEMSRETYRQLQAEQPDLFKLDQVEPESEPRYRETLTPAEFIRDLITPEEWEKIGPLASSDPVVWAWCHRTNAGEIWVKHPDFKAGMAMGVNAGVWTQARADEISKGLLIE